MHEDRMKKYWPRKYNSNIILRFNNLITEYTNSNNNIFENSKIKCVAHRTQKEAIQSCTSGTLVLTANNLCVFLMKQNNLYESLGIIY